VLKTLDILVDVGGEYDPARHRYDHHQRSFEETFSTEHDIKLSSAGLIYKHFGHEILAKLAPEISDADREILYVRMYNGFVKQLDAIDNGVDQYETAEKPRYRVTTGLSSRVARLNPSWNETVGPDEVQERFYKAMNLAGTEFEECVQSMVKCWFPARQIVFDAVAKRKEFDASGQIVVFKDQYTAWKSHIYDAETELKCDPQLLYVIYEDSSGSSWRVQCVSKESSSFENRKSLPAAWRGVRDSDLSSVAGIDGCVFCHASGFIGGNKTLDGALKMAQHALAEPEETTAPKQTSK
jgi:MYG1 exonuclease